MFDYALKSTRLLSSTEIKKYWKIDLEIASEIIFKKVYCKVFEVYFHTVCKMASSANVHVQLWKIKPISLNPTASQWLLYHQTEGQSTAWKADYNSPVACKPGPYGARDSGNTAGLKCQVLTPASSPQCPVTAGLLIPRFNIRENFYIYLSVSWVLNTKWLRSAGHLMGLCIEKS